MGLETMRKKGYDPQTKDLGMGWICNIGVDMRVLSFHGATEEAALLRAGEFLAEIDNDNTALGCQH